MTTSIIGLLGADQSVKAISLVERTLAKKLRKAIAEQKSEVARDAYGSLAECFGADEVPEFVDNGDNAYQFFFQNALKKFGVNGPQDFQDDNTKRQFFDYIDKNWRAQDAVQPQMMRQPSGNIDPNTQTQLPNPATPPMAPQQAGQPSIAYNQPKDQIDGTDEQPLMGDDDEQMASGDFDSDGDEGFGDGILDGSDQSDDDDSQGFDSDAGNNDQNDQGFEGDDEDLNPDLTVGDDDQDNGQAPGQPPVANKPDLDSNFDDEDAFTVDHNDFMPKDDQDDDSDDSDDEDGDDDSAFIDDDNSDDSKDQGGDQDEDSGDDDSSDDDSKDLEGSDKDSGDDGDDDDDPDPDLTVSDKDDDEDAKPKKKAFGEDWGFGQDNADDAVFISERAMFFDKAKADVKSNAGLDPDARKAKLDAINGGMKKHSYVQGELDKIKDQRNAMLKQLRKQRMAIKGDVTKDPDDKQAALQLLAQMAGESRQFFKKQALALKSLHLQPDLGDSGDSGNNGNNGNSAQEQPMPQKPQKPQPPMNDKKVPQKPQVPPSQDEDDEDDDSDEQPEQKKPFKPVKPGMKESYSVRVSGDGPFHSRVYLGEQATKMKAVHKTRRGAETWAVNALSKVQGA